MIKQLKVTAIVAILGVIVLAPKSFAIEGSNDCDAISNGSELQACIDEDSRSTLANDIYLDHTVTIDQNQDITLDLAGHSIIRTGDGSALAIRHGELVIDGTGTVKSESYNHPAIEVSGSSISTARAYSTLYIKNGATIQNSNHAAITIWDNGASEFYGIEVYLRGKAVGKYGVQVEKNVATFEDGLPYISIADEAEINAETGIETDAPGQAIRAEGRATWNIGAAKITGDTGIALRAGRFYLNDSFVTATGPDEAYIHYFELDKSGDTPCDPTTSCEALPGSGAAIQIQEAQTESEDGINDIEIFINGGTYESKYGFAISEYKERTEDPNPTILTDTTKSFSVVDGNLIAFSDVDEIQKEIYGSHINLWMVTDDFSWRFGDGRICADGSTSVKSYDADWLRTHLEIHRFATIDGLDEIYAGLPWVERLLVDYVHFPGPYSQYDFSDAENVALDIYAENKGIKYEDIKLTDIFDIVLLRFEKDNADTPAPGPFGSGAIGDGGNYGLGGGTGKPYSIIRDTQDYPLTFTMKLSDDIPAAEAGYVRKYSVLDLHCQAGGTHFMEECEAIELPVDISEDGTEYTFTTTKFSRFVFTYNDTKTSPEIPGVPNTGISKF